MSEGKLDIAAEGQTVAQASTSPQAQASFKTGEAAEQVIITCGRPVSRYVTQFRNRHLWWINMWKAVHRVEATMTISRG